MAANQTKTNPTFQLPWPSRSWKPAVPEPASRFLRAAWRATYRPLQPLQPAANMNTRLERSSLARSELSMDAGEPAIWACPSPGVCAGPSGQQEGQILHSPLALWEPQPLHALCRRSIMPLGSPASPGLWREAASAAGCRHASAVVQAPPPALGSSSPLLMATFFQISTCRVHTRLLGPLEIEGPLPRRQTWR